MTVKGRVVSLSHVGGLLAEFEDKAPGLGWEVHRLEGGRTIGRVDSVIGGMVENALVHVSYQKNRLINHDRCPYRNRKKKPK